MLNLEGQTAIDFELNDLDGKRYRQEDFRGHWLLLVFHRHLA